MLASAHEKQNSFHRKLEVFINGSQFSKRDRLSACINSGIPIKHHAGDVLKAYHVLLADNVPVSKDLQEERVLLRPFKDNVPEVINIQKKLMLIDDYISFACVHGSLGTGETNAYSDFDALVVLNHSCFKDAKVLSKVASILSSCQHEMCQFDPLQHHGWFVLTEYDLQHYCDSYFPSILFKYAKNFLSDKEEVIFLKKRNSTVESRAAFRSLKQGIITQVNNPPSDLYQMKSFLSKIMLVPAMYLQAVTNEGIYKKESFVQIREHFNDDELLSLDITSNLRLKWEKVTNPFIRWVLSHSVSCRKLMTRTVKVKVSNHLLDAVNESYIQNLEELLVKMDANLAEIERMRT